MARYIRQAFLARWQCFMLTLAVLMAIIVPGSQTAIAAPTPIILDSTVGTTNLYSSIAIGNDDFPVMSYYNGTNGVMALHCTAADCSTRDSALDLNLSATVGTYSSIAIGTDGYPIISYYNNVATQLELIHCTTANCSSFEAPIALDTSGTVGHFNSIAIGTDGYPFIGYFYQGTNDIKIMHCTSVNCSTRDGARTLDSAATPFGNVSVAIGSDGFPAIAYDDAGTGLFNLKFIHCTTVSCSGTDAYTSTTLESTNNVGRFASLLIGSDGYPAVAYYDATALDLRFVHCTSVDCSTEDTPLLMDGGGGVNVGTDTSIAEGADGYPVMTYYDATNLNLKFIHCTAVNCATKDSPLTLDSAGTVGQWSDIAIGTDGYPVISYFGGNALKFIHCLTANCLDDSTPPTVGSTYPTDTSTDVAVSSSVTVTFSESMSADTITTSTFTLKNSSNDAVAASVGYDSGSKTATLNPNDNLLNNETYTATVTTGVKDLTGNALASNYTFTFTTIAGDMTPPVTTLTTSPVAADGTNEWFVSTPDISLSSDEAGFTQYQWNSTSDAWQTGTEPETLAGINTLYYRSVDNFGNTEDVRSRLFKVDIEEPSVQIDAPSSGDRLRGASYQISGSALDPGASGINRVEVKIDAGSWVNAAGDSSWSYNWSLPADGAHLIYARSFDNAGSTSDVSSVGVTVDNSAPTVSSTIPLDGAISVSAGTGVTVILSEEMSPDTVTTNTFTLEDSTSDAVSAIVSYEQATKTATLDPDTDLLAGETYTATVTTGAKDLAGNPLAEGFTFTFTTLAADQDTAAPSVPNMWAQIVSSSEIKLYWSESTDDVEVSAYKLYESPGDALLDTLSGRTKTITGLNPGTTYKYYVKAEDSSGNLSSPSALLTVDTGAAGTTPAGSGVQSTTVSPVSNLSITFDDVSAGGTTSSPVTADPPARPAGYEFRGSVYNISTTATFSGSITVGLPYNESFVQNESSVKLLHWSGGQWADITSMVDTDDNIVFGETTSLSPFAVGEGASGRGWWKASTADLVGDNYWKDQPGNSTYSSPHGGFTTTSNLCKTCHAIHGASNTSFRLLKSGDTTEARSSGEDFGVTGMGSSRANECMYCHDANSGASSKRPYELGATPGTVILGEHTLGATGVPDSDVNGGGAGLGNLADRGGPYVDGKQVLICYSCHSVHGANVIGQDSNHDGTLDSPNAVSGNSLFDGATFDASDGFENWNTKILRIDPANDGSILATGSQGALSNNQWAAEMGMSTPDGGALAVRTGFCADCHNKNPNWETDTSDARPNPKSHPQGRGTDSSVDAYGTMVKVAAHPLEKMGCRGCHFATNNSSRPGPSRFPHQTVGYKLLYDEATQDAIASDTGNPYREVKRMDSICLSCHRVGVEPMGGYEAQEEAACLECHDSKYGAPDIGDEIRKTYAMPIIATRDVHKEDEAQEASSFTYAAKRHVECVDCHNAQRIYPWVDSPLTGIWGLQPTYVTTADYSFAPISQVTKESQLCYKCHAAGTGWPATLPPSTRYFTTVSASPNFVESAPRTQGNKGAEFNTNNSAFHPVEGAGRNLSRSLCLNLQSAFNLDCSSQAAAQTSLQGITLKCTDCHNNDQVGSAGVRGRSSNYAGAAPTGPHGSTNIAILRANYNRTLSYPRSGYDSNDFALCFTCHDPEVLLGFPFAWDSTPGLGATNFYAGWVSSNGSDHDDNLHWLHLVRGNTANARCADCHYNVHSNQQSMNTRYRIDGVSYDNGPPAGFPTRLVNFAPHIQKYPLNPMPRWEYSSTGKRRGCILICHNKDGGSVSMAITITDVPYRPPVEYDLP